MRHIPKIMVAALAFALPALPLLAQALPDRPVPRAEVIAGVKHQFAAMDANHDGIVTADEFAGYRARQAGMDGGADPFAHVGAHWFEHADAKGDGRVTLEEAEARPLQMFDTADVNRDGVLSPGEMQTAQMLMSFKKKM